MSRLFVFTPLSFAVLRSGMLLMVVLTTAGSVSAAEPKLVRGKWTTVFTAKRAPGEKPLPEKGPLTSITQLDLEGVKRADPFHLGKFAINGEFGLKDGWLTRTSGRNAAVELVPEVGDFELEAVVNAESRGGWFCLLGWKEDHGYGIYNVTYKTSGSPWLIQEFRGEAGIEESLEELNHFEWRGQQVLRMSVIDTKLNLFVGTAQLARDVDLPNYHPGAIRLGTYDTPYGPRELKIQSVRYRTVTLKP